MSLGLDSAVHAISEALAAADRRLERWQERLDRIPQDKAVAVVELQESFPGIENRNGEFRAHLELAALAIALKRRVIVLQAVEQAQSDPDNPFDNFVRVLKADQQRLERLEAGIADILLRLADFELAAPQGRLRRPALTSGEVDRLMTAAHRIRALGDGIATDNLPRDLAIEMARNEDGSVVVFPAQAA